MKISSKIMALTMTALLAAAPAMAQSYSGSSNASTGSNVSGSMSNSTSTNASMPKSSSVNTGSSESPMGTNRVMAKSKVNLKKCGITQATLCNLSLTSLDRNGNGTISRKEFRKDKGSMKLFKKIDTNHDGVISKAELNAYNEGKIGMGVNRVKTR
jgi:Ca2+-binding EF-hand superfamily protein